MENLSNEDINVLVNALTTWEAEPAQSQFMTAMLAGIVSGGDRRVMEKEKQMAAESAPEKLRRRDVAIVLKAKLLGMRSAPSATNPE